MFTHSVLSIDCVVTLPKSFFVTPVKMGWFSTFVVLTVTGKLLPSLWASQGVFQVKTTIAVIPNDGSYYLANIYIGVMGYSK